MAGPEPYSANDAATAISAALGKPVKTLQPPLSQWVANLQAAGLGQAFAEGMAEMYDGWNSGHVSFQGKVPLACGMISLAQTVAAWPEPKVA